MLRLVTRVASTLALASALALATTAPALADPPVPIPVPPPRAVDIVGVGAQVTESLFNQFSAEYNASLTAAGDTGSPRLYSWDSTGSYTITPKTGADSIVRPYNSDGAVVSLLANSSRTVDFARSARAPKIGDPTSAWFVALAKDAVSWAAPTGGNAPASLSAAQLKYIYNCQITNWRQIDPALPDAVIRPVLPGYFRVFENGDVYLASDTAAYLNHALDQSGRDHGLVPGPCVTPVDRDNQGVDAILHDPNAIVPYSVGRYLGQAYGGHTTPTDNPGLLVPHALDGVQPVSAATHTINTSFAATRYGRVLVNTVREYEWLSTDAHGTALQRILGRNGWVCRQDGGLPAIRSHGFLPLPPAACGSTMHS
ncbi:substrate-binding domain-containing protein [Kitasatospora sp. NBC_00458]|uniref:substrate-binding domain-containing protein n=1 Tax=Kitasatospora sp. NBC_00458 TaxID=2903568 RepID=UPI002E17824F